MSVPPEIQESFRACGLVVADLGRQGRGVVADKDFRCGDILFRETGWHAADMEALASLTFASPEKRQAATHMYVGGLHHVQMGISSSIEESDDEDSVPAEDLAEKLDMYSKVRYNSFEVGGNSVLLPKTALVNHACQPNVALVATAPFSDCNFCIVVVSRDGIACGQEVLLCYSSDLMFAPVHGRRRQLMTTWNFLCKCGRCEAEMTDDVEDDAQCDKDNHDHDQLTSSEEIHLKDTRLFANRQQVMHRPDLQFPVRKQMFSTQLTAACSILPSLHPRLKEEYERIKDLCNSSPCTLHCDHVCQFYKSLQETGQAVWDDAHIEPRQ